ncbi:MAG TPA: polysaccharide biosynthesis tyrosine autokinase [Terriglobales bacterium]|nr:polysaccharide biosynthesis tyrosine autokinase [Terriglobales bacterium]
MNTNGNGLARPELVAGETAAVVKQMPLSPPGRLLPPLEADAQMAGDDISLAAYWNVLRKRRWTVATATLVLTTLAVIASYRMTPIYRATARVEVEADTPLIQSLSELYQKAEADDAFLQTQIQVLKSDNLAWRTIQELRLGENPAFVRQPLTPAADPERRKLGLIDAFRGRVNVQLVPRTRMLLVGFESSDPRLAADVASALVNNYVDYNFREKYDATRQASGWMEQQLDELKAKVEKSQQALVEYERQNQIVNTGEKQNVLEQMLSDVSRDLTTAESERIQKESLYRQVLANRAQVAALAHSELLQKLEEKAADLRGQYTEVMAQYGPKFPRALRLEQQLGEYQSQIAREQNRVIERVRNDYNAAVSREGLAAQAFARQKEELGRLSQLLVQHNILQREFESNQQLYQSLLQRLKDATVSAGLRSTNIHVVDSALPPTAPVRPRKPLNIALGFLGGLVLGVMCAFAQEGLDRSIHSADQIESLLLAPALAVIPLDRSSRPATRGFLSRLQHRRPPRRRGEVAMTVVHRPKSVLAESYRALRTAVLLSSAPAAPKTVLVTSAHMGEGKSVTALNLAQAMAQRKGPVLIMDCDLRKGSVARALELDADKGLSTVLSGADTLEAALQQCPEQPNLWVLPCGPVPPNPAELLGSDNMAELWKQLSSRYEHIIIDSPPVLLVTDATILSNLADGVILVAESGKTPRAALLRTRRILDDAGARILGVALNKLDQRHGGYYDYGYYRYGYRHYGEYSYGYGVGGGQR